MYRIKNSSVQLNCSHRATSANTLVWEYSTVYPTTAWTIYTLNTDLNNKVTAYPRFHVTGDFSSGEYNLEFNNLKEEDKGYYKCSLRSTSIETVQHLVIVGKYDVEKKMCVVFRNNKNNSRKQLVRSFSTFSLLMALYNFP